MDVTLGERIKARISYGMEGGTLLPAEEGTVVYIHPQGRFYTLEFTFPDREGGVRRFRESYLLPPPADRLMTGDDVIRARVSGWHSKQNGALGKWLKTM